MPLTQKKNDVAALRYHSQLRSQPQHPLQRQPLPPPPINHDTLRRPPASANLIPSLCKTPTTSASSSPSSDYTDPNIFPSGDRELKDENPWSDDDRKRGGTAATINSSSSLSLPAHIDVLPHTTPKSIVDSSPSSSAPSFALLGPARVPFARPPPPLPDG
jgi:hypothetical protein